MARIVFTSGFARRYTEGVREFEVEAVNLRGVLKAMDALYPGLAHHLEEETTVAINGEYHETGYFQAVPPGAEVFFIPRIEGG
jgi:hypothetical protein